MRYNFHDYSLFRHVLNIILRINIVKNFADCWNI